MPRWPTSARPEGGASASTSGSQRYLPRRCAAVTVRPVSAATKCSAPSRCRRTARGWWTSTVAMVRPAIHCARPRRTTSTSGSSGIGRQRPPGRLGGLLLGGLLGPAGAAPVHGAGQDDRGREGLRVVGAVVGDLVGGRPEAAGGAELLQAGLPVQTRAPGRGL